MKNERYLYLDVVKGIAIISVVLGHIILKYESNNFLCIWLYSFHLPIFFIVSGILFALNPKKLSIGNKEFILKKAKNLLYPYLTFSIISIIYLVIKGERLVSIIKVCINTICLFGYGPIWFLHTLLISEILTFFLLKKARKTKLLCIIIMTIFIIIMSNLLQISYWQENIINEIIYKILNLIVRSLIATLFILGGYYFQKKKYKIIKNPNLYVFILLINIFICQINGLIDIHYCKINNFALFTYTAYTTSISIIIIIEKICKSENILSFFGKNSLIIMATHYTLPFIEVAKFLCNNVLRIKNLYALYFFETIIVMLLEYVIIIIINKKLNFLIKIKKLGEKNEEI